jgi:hypothetical protein
VGRSKGRTTTMFVDEARREDMSKGQSKGKRSWRSDESESFELRKLLEHEQDHLRRDEHRLHE